MRSDVPVMPSEGGVTLRDGRVMRSEGRVTRREASVMRSDVPVMRREASVMRSEGRVVRRERPEGRSANFGYETALSGGLVRVSCSDGHALVPHPYALLSISY
jgi:hypothetical protein